MNNSLLNRHHINDRWYLLFIFILSVSSCTKGFLEVKPDKALLVPTTLEDFRLLLDNFSIMNRVPALNGISSDEYYATDAGWESYGTAPTKNSYIWAKDIYEGGASTDWSVPYQQIFYANAVLEGLDRVALRHQSETAWKNIKGCALFYRAFAFYHLAQSFTAPYQLISANELPGIPLRLSADVNERPGRGTLQETYDQILKDLNAAEVLLSTQVEYTTRPGKAAAFALLSRIYLLMEDYENALHFADASLKIKSDLIDYNTLTATAARPIPSGLPKGAIKPNIEVLFYSILNSQAYNGSKASATLIDTSLYKSYTSDDLRRSIFFNNKGNGVVNFKGSYTGNAGLFGGLATDEVFLIRAECYARMGNIEAAMDDLNTLMKNRWKGQFMPFTANSPNEALTLILQERKKELITRGTRWTDLRRLNLDAHFQVTLVRKIKGHIYTLPPNDKRYIFPIPDEELRLNNISQNLR